MTSEQFNSRPLKEKVEYIQENVKGLEIGFFNILSFQQLFKKRRRSSLFFLPHYGKLAAFFNDRIAQFDEKLIEIDPG